MFSRWGEGSGLFGIIAPRVEKTKRGVRTDSIRNETTTRRTEVVIESENFEVIPPQDATPPTTDDAKRPDYSNAVDIDTESTGAESSPPRHQQHQTKEEEEDENLKETDPEIMLLQGQKSREIEALAKGDFCKHQRARYLHKASQSWFDDSYVVGVHYDDGIDRPYYTIVYRPNPIEEPVEKQTTRDRLDYVPWDEKKTREILSQKKRPK